MKKRHSLIQIFIFLIILATLIIIPSTSALNLDVSANPISRNAVLDINTPAKFELTIRNLGDAENIEIYSLVGIDISPSTPIAIAAGETEKITIELMPQESFKDKLGYFTFEYRIKSATGMQKETLTINIINLKQAFAITATNLNPQDTKLKLSIKNLAGINFDKVNVKINSVFFDFEQQFSIKIDETKNFEISLEPEKIKTLEAGSYIINTKLTAKEETTSIESIVKYLEQEDIETTENKEGFFIKRYEVTKTNQGNVAKTVYISIDKSVIPYLFTTFNEAPTKINFKGLKVNYFWEKEVLPDQEFRLIVKTNWLLPFFIIIIIIIIFVIIRKSVEKEVIFRKNVSFVRTRGGEFALKITLRIRAKEFIERINIVDRLPPLVSLYHRFGAITPDKIDEKNKRLEWNIESLNKDEERFFSYIIYSKVGVVGKFELPNARATYERNSKIKEATSNRSFYINQPRRED